MTRVRLDEITVGQEINSGGQGTVYEAIWQAAPWPVVYKHYRPAVQAQVNVRALERMVTVVDRHVHDIGAWPYAIVESDGQVTGFIMRKVPPDYTLWLQKLAGERASVLGQVQHLLNDESILANRRVPIHDRWRLEFLCDTAGALSWLHGRGIAVGDLSPLNLLASFASAQHCFFIDCDAMSVAGESVLPQVETTGWEVPDGETKATTASDGYKFALLAVRLFARDQDATDPLALSYLSSDLAQLATDGLRAEPALRPPPAAWIPLLEMAIPSAATTLPWMRQPAQPDPGPAARPLARSAQTGPAVSPNAASPTLATNSRPSGQPARRRSGVMIGAVLAMLLCVGSPIAACQLLSGAVKQTPGTGSRPVTDLAADPAAQQAAAVQNILDYAKGDRATLLAAVPLISECRDLNGAIASLQQVREGRQRELRQAQALNLSSLPQGSRLAAALVDSMAHSLAADEAFIRWGRIRLANGCDNSTLNDPNRSEADNESKLSTAAKKTFVALWEPVARQYRYPVIQYTDL